MSISTRRRVRRALGVAGLAAATLLAFSGFAQAEPEAAATIKACVHKKTGDVRIVELPKSGGTGCGKDERPVSWSAKGPRGPQGAPGTPGGPGPAGGPPFSISTTATGSLSAESQDIITTSQLAPGSYQLTATVSAVRGDEPAVIDCRLTVGLATPAPRLIVGFIREQSPAPTAAQSQFAASGGATNVAEVAAGQDVVLACSGAGRYIAAVTATAVTAVPEQP
ncbi:hypothetical protein [Catellatospora tritici]|uniref:hypothetical protein n=1 Tax=Catellatospora tritici TaxID=2851566 RepID=UPI001C2CEF81|nr:hypothetical protein [Catellatospora tritici]MBV1848825.1 hypothetical protein [Catellatospora tritici]